MPAPPTKTQRWLDLIAFLAGRRVPVTVEQVMEGVPAYQEDWAEADETARRSVRRKFERDKDELKDLGIPLEAVKFTVNFGREELIGYRLAPGDFYLPYLKLVAAGAPGSAGRPASAIVPSTSQPGGVFEVAERDISLAIRGLREVAEIPGFPYRREARSALRKLTFDLRDRDGSDEHVLFASPPEAEELRGTLRVLSDALLRRKKVGFRYRGMYRDQASERVVRPYGLLYQHAHWYLVGHDDGRDDLRVFRVGRTEDVTVNPRRANSPDFAVPDDFDMARFTGREPWELGGETGEAVEARVRFSFPRSLWAERNAMGVLVAEHPDGSATRAFQVLQTEPFVRWLLSLEGDALVESPAELGDAFRETAGRVAALYRSESSRG